VRELAREKRRLPYGIEVVGFAEEEGQRYKAVFLGSGALTGHFDLSWLDQKDANGITMREAMEHAGMCIPDIAKLERDPARYLGFVEVHIEQGPVLNELDLPLGIVTSINGSVRYVGEVVGMASHAGTTPMDRRRDAAAAVAELVLYAEKRAGRRPAIWSRPSACSKCRTDRSMSCPDAAGSVSTSVPQTTKFAMPAPATCSRSSRESARAAACTTRSRKRCAPPPRRVRPTGQQRWERAVESLGVPTYRMPSGAGHDAMKLHEVMPQAMLFTRGINSGISHNPLEGITADDAELSVRAFQQLIDQLAEKK